LRHDRSHAHPKTERHEGPAPRAAAPDGGAVDAASDLATRVAELEAELARRTDERLRAEADLQNARRRAAREIDEAERRGEARALGAFVTLIDDLERARAAAPPSEADATLTQGLDLVITRALEELARLGVTPIDPHGEPFDPHAHDALLSGESTEHPAGSVSQVIARGYRHGDRLLRPARVMVSTGLGSEAEPGGEKRS
jgi:molecular chaperone GrpE